MSAPDDFASRLKAVLRQHPQTVLTLQWAALVLLVVTATVTLKTIQAPAAFLLGPLLVGIAFGVSGARTRLPPALRMGSQALIGCVIAIALGSAAGPGLLGHVPVFTAIAIATLALSLALGMILTRLNWFGSATAVWGLAPGGSATMVTLAEMNGADPRLTALMQYSRILFAASSAIAVAHFLPGLSSAHPPPTVWFPEVTPRGLFETALLAGAGIVVAMLTRFRPAVFLVPGLIGASLVSNGWLNPEMPPLLAAPAYAVIGLTIGLSFTRETLAACARQIPRIVTAVLALIALCAASGAALSWLFRIDPMTAYLATTPGGVDAVLIVATSAHVDVSFVVAAQMFRLLFVLVAGPFAVALVARAAIRRAKGE
jgi:membrane AbrB-like protein